MTLDDTIARDLTALAADNRRAWRTTDDVLARLEVPTTNAAAPRLDALALTALTQVFARRVARIAAGSVAMLVLTIVLTSAFIPVEDNYDTALLIDRGLIPAFGWFVVPSLAAYLVLGQLAARWFVTGLQRSARPEELGRQWIRRVDAWSTGLSIAAVVSIALLFGVLYFVFDSIVPTPWYDSFRDHTTRRSRLYPLPFALLTCTFVAAWVGRACAHAPRKLRALANIRLVLAATLGIAATVGAAYVFQIWPMAPYAPARLGAHIALTVAASTSVLLAVVSLVLRIREREALSITALCSNDAGAVELLPLHQAFVQRGAWTAAGIASVMAIALLLIILSWPARYTVYVGVWQQRVSFGRSPDSWFLYGGIGWSLVRENVVWGYVIAVALAGFGLGGRLASLTFRRVLGEVNRPVEEVAAHLIARLDAWSLAAPVAGATAATMAYVTLGASFYFRLELAFDPRNTDPTALHATALALGLVVVFAVALVRPGASRWRQFCAHPAALIFGGALAIGPAYVVVELSRRIDTALILSFAVGAFLVFSWIALRWRGRTASADAA